MADEKFTQADIDAAVKSAVDKATADLETRIEAIDAKKQEALDEAKRAKAELRKAQDITPESHQAEVDRADKAEAKAAELEKSNKTLTAERDKAVKGLETETSFTHRLLIQDGVKSALLANGVKDEDFIDSLAAKFAGTASVIVEGDARKAMIGDKELADHIKEWAASDAGKKFVAAANNSGGGSGGGKGGTDGKKATQGEVDAMRPKERAEFFTSGGTIAEAAV